MDEEEHQVARYFVMGSEHIVQCTCGDRFRGTNDKAVMQEQFRHAWAKVNKSG